MQILVTGIAGFIGYHLARALLDNGHTVIGIDDANAYYTPLLKAARLRELGCDLPKETTLTPCISSRYGERCIFYRIDCADRSAMEAVFTHHTFSVIYHLAAQAGVRYSQENPWVYAHSNIVGSLQLLECARHARCPHFIFASSSSVYGANQTTPYQAAASCEHPLSLYAATKKSVEMMAHAYSHSYGLACTGLRFFTVYGPWGRPDMAPCIFTRKLLAGEPVTLFNYGDMQRDFTYIDDVISACIALVEHPAEGCSQWDAYSPDPQRSHAPYRLYNIGNARPVPLEVFLNTLGDVLGIQPHWNKGPMPPGDVQVTSADVQPMQQQFAYQPQTDLFSGLTRMVRWYKDYQCVIEA